LKPNARPAQEDAGKGCWTPETEADVDAIREQLEQLLESPWFKTSRHYPALLRHVVNETLEGRIHGLKERTLGVEVFGRDPSYDTNADPVVRMTATQVRRRLMEYYQEPGREAEIRVLLPVGSYVPTFQRPVVAESGAAPDPIAEVAPEILVSPQPEIPPSGAPAASRKSPPALIALLRNKRLAYVIAVVAVLALVAAYFTLIARPRMTAMEKFWGPVWDSSNSVMICVGGGQSSGAEASQPASQGTAPGAPQRPPSIRDVIRLNKISWAEALTLSNLVTFVRANGKTPVARRSTETSFTELRNTPAVLVGGYNNQWILRLTNPLRFSYQGDWDASLFWIQDQKNPSQRLWAVDVSAPHSAFSEDYGIIMRYFDPTTERTVVVASGIAYYGTVAAGEFLTSPKYLEMIDAGAPGDWQRKNLQVVFATRIINGETGPPRILATYFW
jgi:hypothetical protein